MSFGWQKQNKKKTPIILKSIENGNLNAFTFVSMKALSTFFRDLNHGKEMKLFSGVMNDRNGKFNAWTLFVIKQQQPKVEER